MQETVKCNVGDTDNLQSNNAIYLEKLWQTEMEILDSIVYACQQLNLKYVLYAGSLLGAVRHKGFIPWDDDIDVIMPREDYDIFIEKAQGYMDQKFFVQHYTTESETNVLWTKVRNVNTRFMETDNASFDICHGVFVDVFPFDRIKSGKVHSQIEFIRRKKFNMIAGCYCRPYVDSISNPIKKIGANMIWNLICLRRPICDVLKKEENRRRKQNRKADDCYPVDFFANRGTLTGEELFDSVDMKFEDRIYKGSQHYDICLRKMYGADYMQMPPVEKRITHKPDLVRFEDGTEY